MTGQGCFGILVLAAGSSSRLGKPKQLLSYKDKNLLSNTIDEAKKSADGKVVVILGGNYQLIEAHINDPEINVVYNTGWEEGISSSVRAGLSELNRANPDAAGLILTVCDQPFITEQVFNNLIGTFRTSGKSIIASTYAGTLGTPVLFSKIYFGDLMALKGKEGAKKLLEKYKENVAAVPFEKGEIDIDTPEDYSRLLRQE
jgi:molybdenum cofactor cytidylyltransferase